MRAGLRRRSGLLGPVVFAPMVVLVVAISLVGGRVAAAQTLPHRHTSGVPDCRAPATVSGRVPGVSVRHVEGLSHRGWDRRQRVRFLGLSTGSELRSGPVVLRRFGFSGRRQGLSVRHPGDDRAEGRSSAHCGDEPTRAMAHGVPRIRRLHEDVGGRDEEDELSRPGRGASSSRLGAFHCFGDHPRHLPGFCCARAPPRGARAQAPSLPAGPPRPGRRAPARGTGTARFDRDPPVAEAPAKIGTLAQPGALRLAAPLVPPARCLGRHGLALESLTRWGAESHLPVPDHLRQEMLWLAASLQIEREVQPMLEGQDLAHTLDLGPHPRIESGFDVPADEFASLVRDAVDSLPSALGKAMTNVAVVIDEENPDQPLYGLYQGHPLSAPRYPPGRCIRTRSRSTARRFASTAAASRKSGRWSTGSSSTRSPTTSGSTTRGCVSSDGERDSEGGRWRIRLVEMRGPGAGCRACRWST